MRSGNPNKASVNIDLIVVVVVVSVVAVVVLINQVVGEMEDGVNNIIIYLPGYSICAKAPGGPMIDALYPNSLLTQGTKLFRTKDIQDIS